MKRNERHPERRATTRALVACATLALAMLVIGLPLLALLGVVVAQAVRVGETSVAWATQHLTDREDHPPPIGLDGRFRPGRQGDDNVSVLGQVPERYFV